jgi:hypothetical protein
MILRLEHVEDVRPERLRGLHDVGPGGIGFATDVEWRRCAVHLHAVLDQRIHELGGGQEIALIRRQHIRPRIAPLGPQHQLLVLIDRHGVADEPSGDRGSRRRVGALTTELFLDCLNAPGIHRPAVARALFNRVLAHLVDVVEEDLAVAGGDVEHRTIRGDRVLDRLAEVPGLRLDREWQIGAGNLPIGHERHLNRRRVAYRLGEQADHVVEIHRRAQTAVPPRRVVGAAPHRRPGLVFRDEAVVHRGADDIEAGDDERVIDVVGRIAKWRRE